MDMELWLEKFQNFLERKGSDLLILYNTDIEEFLKENPDCPEVIQHIFWTAFELETRWRDN